MIKKLLSIFRKKNTHSVAGGPYISNFPDATYPDLDFHVSGDLISNSGYLNAASLTEKLELTGKEEKSDGIQHCCSQSFEKIEVGNCSPIGLDKCEGEQLKKAICCGKCGEKINEEEDYLVDMRDGQEYCVKCKDTLICMGAILRRKRSNNENST